MRKIGIKNTKFYSNLLLQKDFLHKADIKLIYLFLPALLSLAAAFFEGVSVGLLVPMVKGIIEMNFRFARELPVFKDIIERFPRLFVTPNSSVFIMLLIIIFMAAVMKNILLYFTSVSIDFQVRKFASNMRKLVLDRYFSFGKLFFDRRNQGSLYNVLIGFTYNAATRLGNLHEFLKWIFLLAVYAVIMFMISWKLTIFVMIIPPLLYYSLRWLVEKIKKTSKFYTDSRNILSSKAFNIFSCFPLIKLYAREGKERELFGYASDRVATFEFSMDKKQRLIFPLQEIVMLTVILLLISAMAFLIIREQSSAISGFLVYFYLLRRISASIGTLTHIKAGLAATSGPLNEVLKVFDDEDKYFITDGEEVFDGLKSAIKFNHLDFSYVEEVPVLKDVTFSVEKGKTTAIVGPTGSGKTTLINLLLRFYECPPSSILIDGADIREFTLKSLRAHMALVSQETLLFNDTLRMNITYGAEGVDNDTFIDVIKKTRLYDFIMNLPDGFDTLIGDRGVKLSGGEKQRVAIARALLKGSEILILDEATSSLDSITERLIQESIEEAVKDRTAIVIAHRLSTIKNADKIVVIEDGRFVEEGSLNELLDKKGKFYRYWQEQKFD